MTEVPFQYIFTVGIPQPVVISDTNQVYIEVSVPLQVYDEVSKLVTSILHSVQL